MTDTRTQRHFMSQSKRPNILITLADDQPAYACGAYGNSRIRTPALDALAERGTCFTNACQPGSHVGAVCAPNRAMLFTGRHYWHIPNQIKGWWEEGCERFEAPEPDPACTPMLGEILRQNGYHTFGTGKWHNMPFSFHRNFCDGEAIWFHGGNALQIDLMQEKQMPEVGWGRGRPEFLRRGKQHWKHVVHGYDATGEWSPWNSYHDPRHGVEIFTEAAVNFIETYDGDKPFFLYCPFYAPHNPLETLPEWERQYPPEAMKLPENFRETIAFDNGGLLGRERIAAGWRVTEETARQWIAGLYALTAHMDDGIRRIHEALERNGYLDNTITIHTSDHGKSSGQHGYQGKWTLYEHDLQVPCIVAGPDIPRGLRSDALVHQHDLFPTLLERAGVEPPEGTYFETLEPLLRTDAKAGDGREYLFAADRASMRSIRDQRYKLIQYERDALLERGVDKVELFDLRDDPHELRDLAGEPAHAGRIERMRRELLRWRTRLGDPTRESPGVLA